MEVSTKEGHATKRVRLIVWFERRRKKTCLGLQDSYFFLTTTPSFTKMILHFVCLFWWSFHIPRMLTALGHVLWSVKFAEKFWSDLYPVCHFALLILPFFSFLFSVYLALFILYLHISVVAIFYTFFLYLRSLRVCQCSDHGLFRLFWCSDF